jgi:hypothetical protein
LASIELVREYTAENKIADISKIKEPSAEGEEQRKDCREQLGDERGRCTWGQGAASSKIREYEAKSRGSREQGLTLKQMNLHVARYTIVEHILAHMFKHNIWVCPENQNALLC